MNQHCSPKSQGFDEISSKSSDKRDAMKEGRESQKFLQLFGELVEVDTWLDWRVHYGQRVGAIFGAASMTSYLLNTFLYGNRSVYLLVACVFFCNWNVCMFRDNLF